MLHFVMGLLTFFAITSLISQFVRKDLHPFVDSMSAYLTPVFPLGWIVDVGYIALSTAFILSGFLTSNVILLVVGIALYLVMLSAVIRSFLPEADVVVSNDLESVHRMAAGTAFAGAALWMVQFAFTHHSLFLQLMALLLPITALIFYFEWRNKTSISEKLAIIEITAYLYVAFPLLLAKV